MEDRIKELEKEVAELKNQNYFCKEHTEENKVRIAKIFDFFYGNGENGVKLDISKLEGRVVNLGEEIKDMLSERTWAVRLIIGAVILGILSFVISKGG